MPDKRDHSVPVGVQSITIENFRGIDHLELKFLDAKSRASDIYVFAGPNGSGKTSVLEACLIALGHAQLVQGPRRGQAVRSGARRYQISAVVQTEHGIYSTFTNRELPQWHSVPENTPSAQVEVPCLYFSSWRAPKLVGPVSITSGRKGKRILESEKNRLWLVKQYLVNARAHAVMQRSGTAETPPLYQTAIERLNQVWNSFHPGRDQSFTVEPISADPETGFDVFLSDRNGTRLSVDALSSGQLELFCFFGAFLRSKFQEGVVIIDEPELHLDPQWHTVMLRAIRTFLPRAQLIVATHSPEVLDSVYSFQRILLLPKGDPRTVAWQAKPTEVLG
ncbi:MAG: AAA family ATPase [Gemmataceae bacterium]|nr:AAA family ATPase [Gemmataceae bacterium]